MKAIVVNATALHQGGALSILKQFIEAIPEDDQKWVIWIPENVIINSGKENVFLYPIKNVKALPKRFWWDAFGIKRWLREKNIEPVAAISLQNTGFRVGKCVPTFIYYHQSIPFYSYRWNPLNKRERTFWFYKNIYTFFVKLFLKKDTIVFVQLDFIKSGFIKKFGHSSKNIEVYSPNVVKLKLLSTNKANNSTNKIKLFYPATPHFYKNHRVIEEALKLTSRKLELALTTDGEEQILGYSKIKHLGMQPYERVCELYLESDALVFPSYIETFGLPLLEAAMTGLPIIAADLPYSREVLNGYEGVRFVDHKDPEAWAKEIDKLEKGVRFKPFDISDRKGWPELINSIKYKLQ